MYTGTLIRDLMVTVEHAELRVEQKEAQRQREEEKELQAIFAMQIPILQGDHVFMGAA